MEHPFISSLTDKSTDEIAEAITNLSSKLQFAYRMGKGPMISQLQMALESYKAEYTKRMDEMYKKQNLNNQINITAGNR